VSGKRTTGAASRHPYSVALLVIECAPSPVIQERWDLTVGKVSFAGNEARHIIPRAKNDDKVPKTVDWLTEPLERRHHKGSFEPGPDFALGSRMEVR
jgi:hypothetical protein